MRAVRITQANWLNAEVAGDRGTVKLVSDDMAREAVELWHIAEYAPEYDREQPPWPPAPAEPVVTDFPAEDRGPEDLTGFGEEPVFVGPEAAAARMDALGIPQADDDSVSGVLAEPEGLKMPWSNASKAAWIDWAVHSGADMAEAASLTKNELMSRYGERL
jgi:hypothetical protein